MTDSLKKLNALSKDLNGNLKVNGELNGAVKNMSRVIQNMLDNVYDAHLQVKNYYTAQQTLSTWLYDIKNMSLALNPDYPFSFSPKKEFDTPKASFLERLKFFIIRYSESYSKNSSTVTSSKDKSLDNIKIWVNWGRDQVKVLNSLIQDSFTPKSRINVTVEQVNATLVQGVIFGNSPDLYLHMARTEPVNLAMRGVLYNLRNFDDYEKVLEENFQKGSDTPYLYKDGAYALPDTQNFFVMFYRTDIFDKLSINPPKTWEDFLSVTGILQRNKMNAYLPYTKLGAAGTVNIAEPADLQFSPLCLFSAAKVSTTRSLTPRIWQVRFRLKRSNSGQSSIRITVLIRTQTSFKNSCKQYPSKCKLYAMPDLQRRRT